MWPTTERSLQKPNAQSSRQLDFVASESHRGGTWHACCDTEKLARELLELRLFCSRSAVKMKRTFAPSLAVRAPRRADQRLRPEALVLPGVTQRSTLLTSAVLRGGVLCDQHNGIVKSSDFCGEVCLARKTFLLIFFFLITFSDNKQKIN